MGMTRAIIEPTREADGDQCVALRDIGWQGYLGLLRVRGDRSMPRMVYLDGTAWLETPSFAHERLRIRLGQLVMEIVVEFDIPCTATGSTTFRRKTRRGGVEGDQTYYLANEARIRDKDQISLRIDPPPDLAIEAVYSHDAEAAIEVYRRFRVPEVWLCNGMELVILVLKPNGYVASLTSASFPFLSAADVHEWVSRPQTVSETEWMRALRTWVRQTLKPRVRRQANEPG